MIKINDKYYFRKDLHGYQLLEKVIAKKRETGEEYEKFNSTFHSNLDQVAAKVLHESGDNVSGDISDLISAWNYCTNNVAATLKKLEATE